MITISVFPLSDSTSQYILIFYVTFNLNLTEHGILRVLKYNNFNIDTHLRTYMHTQKHKYLCLLCLRLPCLEEQTAFVVFRPEITEDFQFFSSSFSFSVDSQTGKQLTRFLLNLRGI